MACTLHKTHNVFLVIYHGQKVEQKYRDIINHEHLQVIYLSGGSTAKLKSFYKLLKENNTYIIFSYLLTTNLIGAVIGKLAGVKYIVGGIRNAKLDAKKLPIQRFIHNRLSTYTIFNNYTGLDELKSRGFKNQNAVVISNGFELNTHTITRQENPIINIITVGRFVQQKGYFVALKLMAALKQQGYNFKYLLIGYGELESQIRAEIIALQLSSQVEVIINPSDINSYYQMADIYLCTSFFEGLSNTVMEALSYSLPVVATDVGDNNRLVQHEKNGYIVSDMSPESFTEPLKKLITSSALRNVMGAESYKIIKENYSVDAFYKNYTEFITRCDLELSAVH